MAKKNALKVQEEEIFSFDEMYDEDTQGDEMMMGLMGGVFQAGNNQMMTAIELTKLIIANSAISNIEERVLSAFKKATKVVGENYPLKNILEQMEQ